MKFRLARSWNNDHTPSSDIRTETLWDDQITIKLSKVLGVFKTSHENILEHLLLECFQHHDMQVAQRQASQGYKYYNQHMKQKSLFFIDWLMAIASIMGRKADTPAVDDTAVEGEPVWFPEQAKKMWPYENSSLSASSRRAKAGKVNIPPGEWMMN